jgi:uncharacterized protein
VPLTNQTPHNPDGIGCRSPLLKEIADLLKQCTKRSLLILRAAFLLAQTAACSVAPSAEKRPDAAIALQGRVTDAGEIISPQAEVRIAADLAAFEARTKHQVVVVTVKSLGGRDIANFTRDLANAWGIGRKDYDDGVVVLVAPTERKVRIAVGYGLERVLTDDRAKIIIDEGMIPHFRAGQLDAGIEAGAKAVVREITEAERTRNPSSQRPD